MREETRGAHVREWGRVREGDTCEVPDTSRARVNTSLGMKACERECLRDCSCTAYTSADDTRGDRVLDMVR